MKSQQFLLLELLDSRRMHHYHWRNGYTNCNCNSYIMPKRITFSHSKQTIPHFMDKLLVWASNRSRIWRCQLQLWRESGKGSSYWKASSLVCSSFSTTTLYHQDDWVGLKCVVMVVRLRNLWNKTTREVQFYLTRSDARKLGQAIRLHWELRMVCIGL